MRAGKLEKSVAASISNVFRLPLLCKKLHAPRMGWNLETHKKTNAALNVK